MKTNLLKSIFISLILVLGVSNTWAEPWLCRSTAGGKIATKTVGDKLNNGNEWNYEYTTNGGWSSATDIQVYVGTSTSSYTTVNAGWKSDVKDTNNKNVAANIGGVSFDKSGKWYAVGKYKSGNTTAYTTKKDEWTNNTTLSMGSYDEPYWEVTPPAVSDFTVSVSGYLSGTGTSNDPYIVQYGKALTVNLSGSKAKTDVNSTLQYNTSGTWNTTTSKTISNITSATKTSITVKMRCHNSTASLSGTESSKTIYYRSEDVYTVTFDANGHGTAPTAQTVSQGSKATQPAAPTATGYTFGGWYREAGCTNAFDFNTEINANITLYAKWTANTNTAYTVKHYKQLLNGTYSATPDETENLTGTTDASVTPAVKSYTGFTAPSTQTVTIKADGSLVVTYNYTRNSYNLTWDVNKGNALTGSYTSGSVKYGAAITNPADPTREGHVFKGWHNGTSIVTPATTMPANDLTYTAQWQKKIYTVAYGVVGNANGTIALNSEDPAIKNQNKQDFEYGSTLTFTATPADGYRVQEPQGWFSDEAGKTSLGNGTAKTYTINSLTDAASVFVSFEKIPASTYIVTFDANGGSGTMNSQSFTENEPQNLTTNTFTRTGYTFAGWNTADDGTGTSYPDGQLVTLTTAGLTLYAQWTANLYTITLDKPDGTGGTSEVAVHYDNNDYSVNPVSVPSIQGYAFMGYYVAENGSGFQVVDATGNWVKSAHGYTDASGNWKKASDITLYAHFEKAQITAINLDKTLFESGEDGFVTVKSYEIAPTPAGTVVVCWTLCYTNGTPVEGHNAIEENGTVKFAIDGLSAGTYKIVASLRLNDCTGEELDRAEATFVVAGSYTVTIKYTCDGQEIAGRTTIEGHPSRQTAVTAPNIGGYNFVEWELGDGISTEDALTDETIDITANYEGYLTATYEKKKLIFLDLSTLPNKSAWTAPHVYLYNDSYWDENNGAGATGSQCVAEDEMIRVPNTTDMWYFEYENFPEFAGYVAFTSSDKTGQNNFWDCEAIYRGDFSIGTPVFVPAQGQTANEKNKINGNSAKYYNKGHWTKYMGGTGYTLKIYNHKEKEGRKELMSVPFTGSSLYLPFTAVVDLEAGQTFGYKIVRDKDKWYKNDADGTMTVDNHENWPFIEDKNDGLACGIKTVAAGNHTFTLTLDATSGDFKVSVDYPVTVGDYRILYKDNTRTTYKPSDIKKAEELNPVTSFFIRPNSNPELKIQTAAHITDGGVTWYTADNHIYFKPNENWKSDGARFAAWFNGDKWKDLNKNGDVYSCEIPSGATEVIFCRMDPKKATNNWSNKWDQTGHLKLTTENLYTLNEGEWGNKLYLKPNSNWLQKDDSQKDPRFAAYFFNSNSDNAWVSMGNPVDGVYSCDIPAKVYKNVIFCRMNGGNETNEWNNKYNQSSDLIVPTDGKTLYTIKDDTWGDGYWSVKEGSWSTISGSITDLTEELKKKLGEIKGDIKKAPDSVYTIHLEQHDGEFSIAKVVPYTGNFYIRVDAAAGKWYDYKTNPDNLMTYSAFSESDANSFGEKFSHYKTEWCSDGMNVKFVIANDYSPCISDTLVQDTENSLDNIDVYGNLKNEDKYNANIRFMWYRKTNKVSRAYVAAATDDAKKFLVLKTDKQIKNNKDELVNEIIFQDTQNWIYEYTIKAQPETRVKLYACYPDVVEAEAQHFRGKYDNPTTFKDNNSVQIIGGKGEAWNTIRVLYDFKTNRLMGAWVPESAISTEQAIAADLMVIRRHQEDATCVTLTNENSKLTDVKTAYGAMQFNRWTINNRGGADDLDVEHCTKASGSHRVYDEDITNQYHPILPLAEQTSIYERGLYFISFPFDVHLSDVFGFGTYGTHWVISTYNGKRRAERGYFAEDCINEDCTNWDYIWDPSGFVMKANEGYLLSLDLDLMKHDNTSSFWANNISQVELFFPSTAAITSIEKTDYTMPALTEEYLCKINHNTPDGDRRVKDSYWRCIGVPSFADYNGSLTTDGESTINWKDDYTWEADKEVFPFLYEWNVTNNDLVVRSTNSYKFRATYAYLIQNGNKIHWKAVNTKPASIIARDQTENVSNYEWKIALLRNDAPADHTFIRMTDNESVTSAFDFHQDLSKEFNYGANIYTLVGYERLAANSLPMNDSTTIIPLGVSAQEAGDYTITMPEGVESVGVTLVDAETGTHTNLSAGMEYTFTLNRGTYDGRLYLEISPIEKTPTDLEYVDEATRNQNVRKFIIDGKLYLQKDGMLYDAQGRCVK